MYKATLFTRLSVNHKQNHTQLYERTCKILSKPSLEMEETAAWRTQVVADPCSHQKQQSGP